MRLPGIACLLLATNLPVPSFGNPPAALVPGAVNPAVTQANIQRTICVPGWTRTVRPPVPYTNALKIR